MSRRPVTVFFKLGALGDTIMTTPALRAYRKSFPHEEIIYIIGKTCEAALLGNPNIDRLITFDDDAFYTGRMIARMKTVFKVTNLIKSFRAEKIFIMQREAHGIMRQKVQGSRKIRVQRRKKQAPHPHAHKRGRVSRC
ncbi:MAG: hypothetical protein LRY51_02320 [Geovibrio sp.]|nr:hypothetical protein [Geovibrio sp.]